MTIASTITPPSSILNPTNTTEAAARQQDTYSRIKEVVGHSLLAISSVFALVTIGLYITTCVITLVLPASFLYLSFATILVMFVAGTFLIDSDTTNEELLERRPQPNTGSQPPLASGSATRESSAPIQDLRIASSTLPSSSPRAKNEELQKALIGLKEAIESLQEKKVINCDYATALEVFSSSHRELQKAQILLGPDVIHKEVIRVLELCAKIRELRSQPAQKRPVTPADPHKAVARSGTRPRPGGSCLPVLEAQPLDAMLDHADDVHALDALQMVLAAGDVARCLELAVVLRRAW
jgi:hypothetical protein